MATRRSTTTLLETVIRHPGMVHFIKIPPRVITRRMDSRHFKQIVTEAITQVAVQNRFFLILPAALILQTAITHYMPTQPETTITRWVDTPCYTIPQDSGIRQAELTRFILTPPDTRIMQAETIRFIPILRDSTIRQWETVHFILTQQEAIIPP